ncbi:JmjC domain-containing protein [Streptomyces blattellae]|uniref:JmjC domain-containing protein n=1 Tax=Streptomyces blattellae TaxID=2569855 RepID=UPI0012B97FA2|nr:cupin domain-containing protein [Streptomyces blattellae]
MSLSLLLPEDGVADLLTTWPDEPRVYERGRSALDRTITADDFEQLLDTGCVPAEEVAAIHAGPSDRSSFKTANGRTDATKLRRLRQRGYTIRLGNLQRWLPFFHDAARAIQQETGYSNYVHCFLTPAGKQGLRHHWDQQMALIVQLSGAKTWQLWRPMYNSPMREHQESFRVWQDDFIPGWEAAGPDTTIDLTAGQTLLLPRGWIHNPHALNSAADSVHLTFAIRERTPLWLSEKMLALAIEDPAFRRVIPPRDMEGTALAARLGEVRQALVEFLHGLDMNEVAVLVREAAVAELEYST